MAYGDFTISDDEHWCFGGPGVFEANDITIDGDDAQLTIRGDGDVHIDNLFIGTSGSKADRARVTIEDGATVHIDRVLIYDSRASGVVIRFDNTGEVNIQDFDVRDDQTSIFFTGGGAVNIDDFVNDSGDDNTQVTFQGGPDAEPPRVNAVNIRRFRTYSDNAIINFIDRADVHIDRLQLYGDNVDVFLTPGNYFFEQWWITRSRGEVFINYTTPLLTNPRAGPVNIASEYVRFSQNTDLNWDNGLGGGDPEHFSLYIYSGPYTNDIDWTDPVRMNGIVVAQPNSPNSKIKLNGDSHELHGAIFTQGALDISRLTLTHDTDVLTALENIGLVPVWSWREEY